MSKAINLFCDLIEKLDPPLRDEVPMWCCSYIGEFGHMTTDTLRKRMTYLVETAHVRDSLLINGMIAELRTFFDRLEDQDKVSERIDADLTLLQELKEKLETPKPERNPPYEDEPIKDFIGKLENTLSNRPKRREDARIALDWLDWLDREVFTDAYWVALTMRRGSDFFGGGS